MKIILIILLVLIVYGIIKLIPTINSVKGNEAYSRGDIESATRFYEKAAASGKVVYKIRYALMLMRKGEFKQAENQLNEIIISRGVSVLDKSQAKLYRCMLYQKTDRLEEALSDAEEVYESIKNTTVYGALGYLRQLKGGAELDFCLEAYDFNPDDRDICDNLSVAYLRSGEIEKAEEIASDLREKFPQFVEGYYHSALIAKEMGNNVLALEYLEKIADCKRTVLTTVSEDEIEALRKELENA